MEIFTKFNCVCMCAHHNGYFNQINLLQKTYQDEVASRWDTPIKLWVATKYCNKKFVRKICKHI